MDENADYLIIVGPVDGGRWFRAVFDDARQVDGGAFVDVNVWTAEDLGNWLCN
jgi:hypothetical protein